VRSEGNEMFGNKAMVTSSRRFPQGKPLLADCYLLCNQMKQEERRGLCRTVIESVRERRTETQKSPPEMKTIGDSGGGGGGGGGGSLLFTLPELFLENLVKR
jgi:hypothetical protein